MPMKNPNTIFFIQSFLTKYSIFIFTPYANAKISKYYLIAMAVAICALLCSSFFQVSVEIHKHNSSSSSSLYGEAGGTTPNFRSCFVVNSRRHEAIFRSGGKATHGFSSSAPAPPNIQISPKSSHDHQFTNVQWHMYR